MRLSFRPQNGGHYLTKLTKDCAAICDWPEALREDQIEDYGGKVGPHQMNEIIRKMNEIIRKITAIGGG